jgi:NADPH-dependent curcumin reductase CurA
VAASVNRQVILKSRPAGIPQEEHFEIVQRRVPELGPGQLLVRNIYLSVDPAMRGWVSAVSNYAQPVAIGDVMRAYAAGRIEASRDSRFREGEYVTGQFGWQDYAAVEPPMVIRRVADRDLPLSTALGVLGMTGLTAYFGLLEIGQPKPGETVAVSTAAGAVGSCVGQIARLRSCRAVGITGGPEKMRVCLEEFQYDAAIDYKAGRLDDDLARAAPNGVDVYFDNTSGSISDTVLRRLNVGARVIVCGTAAIDSWDPWPAGPRVERHLLVKRARMQGMLISDFRARYPEGIEELRRWVRNGSIRYREDIVDGIEHAPGAIASLYRGENLGKRLIRLANE